MQLDYVMHRMTSGYARFHIQNCFFLRSSKNNLSFHPLNYDRILFPKMLVHTALLAEVAHHVPLVPGTEIDLLYLWLSNFISSACCAWIRMPK